MKEVLTTSSALILALLGLRLAFRKSISRRRISACSPPPRRS